MAARTKREKVMLGTATFHVGATEMAASISEATDKDGKSVLEAKAIRVATGTKMGHLTTATAEGLAEAGATISSGENATALVFSPKMARSEDGGPKVATEFRVLSAKVAVESDDVVGLLTFGWEENEDGRWLPFSRFSAGSRARTEEMSLADIIG